MTADRRKGTHDGESKFQRAGNWSTKFTTRRSSKETHTDEKVGKREDRE